MNTLHFLPENGNCRIFVKINGAWQQVEAKEFGSYLVFGAESENMEIAVIEYTLKLIPIIIASALALLIISAAVTACVISKKKKAKV